jgi:Dolichyl-phosphate-mannose-protein mannosyltransferase
MANEYFSHPFRIYSTLFLLLLLAAITIPGLKDQSLWVDEGWSVAFTDGQSPQDVVAQIIEDRHPPLYFLSLWAWRQVAGSHEITMRLLSSFAALLAGACLFRWGKVLFGDWAGWLALLAFVLLDKQVDFSREIRHYTWLMLWSTASSWLLLRWMFAQQRSPHLRSHHSILYVLAVIAGLYTHNLMFVILLAQVVYALLVLRPSRLLGRLLLLWVMAGIAFLPWSMVFIYQYRVRGGVGHHLPLQWHIAELLTPEYLGQPVILVGGLLLLGIASIFMSPRKVAPRAVLMPTLQVLVPLALMVGTASINEDMNFITERNLSLLIPPLMLLLGLGITAFDSFTRHAIIIFLLINGLLTTSSHQLLPINGSYVTAPRSENPPWRQISQNIEAHDLPSLVIMDVGGDAVVLRYHLKQEAAGLAQPISIYDLLEQPDPLAALRFEQLGDAKGLWYIFRSNDPLFRNALSDWGYIRTAEYTDFHIGSSIYTYRYDRQDLLESLQMVYDNTFRLHRFYYPEVISSGEEVTVSLWWSAVTRSDTDYSISVFLLDSTGRLVAQHDGYAQNGTLPTSQWKPDRLLYDAHRIDIPENLPAGTYTINVKVYNEVDILRTSSDKEFFNLGIVHITE